MTQRRYVIATLLAVLVLVAPIVSGATGVRVIDQDTTESDFAAGTQTNATVVGSGESANVLMGVAARGADDTQTSTTSEVGLIIEPKYDASSVTINVSSLTTGATTAYLETTGGSQLDSTSISDGTATLSASLTAGTQYRVLVDAGGSSYNIGFDSGTSFPYEGGGVVITDAIEVGGSFDDALGIRSVALNGINPQTTDGSFTSAEFDATRSDQVAVNASLVNSNATVTVTDVSTGSTLATETITASGNTTVSYPDTDGNVSVSVTGQASATTWNTTVHDITVLDQLDNSPEASDVQPADGVQVTSDTATFSVAVNDSDFGDPGDTVTAELFLKRPDEQSFSHVYNESVTSNTTVSTSQSVATAGEYEFYWRLTDSFGNNITTATRTVQTPSTLIIRNESNTSQRVTGTDVQVTFYSDDGQTVVTRTDSDGDGEINLGGLPGNSQYSAVVEADGYIDRTVIVDSLYEQRNVYLLSTNATTADVVFSIDDATSRFGQETTVYVERAITLNNTTEYDVVTSGELGASGELATTLQDDTRYRIRVVNAEGETRVLGAYTTNGDDAAVLPIGTVRIDADVSSGDLLTAKLVEENGQRAVRVVYLNPEENTSSLTLEITNLNTGETIRANSTETGPYGRYVETTPVNASAPQDSTWVVNATVTYADGSSYSRQIQLGDVTGFQNIPVSDRILSLTGWVVMLSMTGLVVIRSPTHAPITAAVVGGAMTVLGVTAIPLPALGLAGAIGVVTIMGGDS